MVVGGAPELSDRDGAETIGKTDIEQSATGIATVVVIGITSTGGVDTPLVSVYCRLFLGYLARALDARARIKIRHTGIFTGI